MCFFFAEKLRRDNTKKPAKKEPCPFCQEQKKRPLIAYMRKMALEKQKSRICEEEENDEGHCHYDDANETGKKWIVTAVVTMRFDDLTFESNMDMILDILMQLIRIRRNILICAMGFHLTEHLSGVMIICNMFLSWNVPTTMFRWMETQWKKQKWRKIRNIKKGTEMEQSKFETDLVTLKNEK